METQESTATEVETQDMECPVCYECFGNTERTLSCGHVFCHDCLVKTLVSVSRDGHITRENIICPICRHLTFISKQNTIVANTCKDVESGQSLEVPVSLLAGTPSHPSENQDWPFTRTSPRPAYTGLRRALQYFRWISTRLTQPQFKSQNNVSQIFIISSQGRPMADEDEISVVTTTVNEPIQRRRQRRRICTTARCLLILLVLFTVLTLIIASLPWILLG
ncbi:RING finger protein 222 [Conger conger]|uniref:RING finger protein 222 n=1 Tax=Conger conger TaxID=82655 RepID=UPI002A5AFB77|nr:RING finger protein 222 [Conger conger]